MIKDIAIHLTGEDEDRTRIAHAVGIAKLFDAHITGLQVHALPELIGITDPIDSGYLQRILAESHGRAQRVNKSLREQLTATTIPFDLRMLDAYPGIIGTSLAEESRTSDLFVGTRPYGEGAGPGYVEEAVLFKSARGCLFVPPGKTPPGAYNTIFVAWKNTREAARAVADALPFLQRASRVAVLLVEEHGAGERNGMEPGADIGRYLSRHGVSAEIRVIAGRPHVGEALLGDVTNARAQMIVMGGYGHSRFREWILGGVTRHVLTHADVPVLIAH